MSDTALVVMARYPEAGKAKTRLARSIGDYEAAQLYQAFLTDLAQRFARQAYDLHWAYTPAGSDYPAFVSALTPSLAQDIRCFPQEGADLAARLLHAFQWTYRRNYQRTIVIGSDSPHLSWEVVAHARAVLDKVDIALGPADDGGYYLIAMRKPHDIFCGIPMSTSEVTQRTIELAREQDLTVRLLKPLFDIDELPDLLRLAQLLAANSALAPVTAAHLASMQPAIDHIGVPPDKVLKGS